MAMTPGNFARKGRFLAFGFFLFFGCGRASETDEKALDLERLCGQVGISGPYSVTASCGSLVQVSCAVPVDGPYLYVNRRSGRIRAICSSWHPQ
jgi:hypothetical protein